MSVSLAWYYIFDFQPSVSVQHMQDGSAPLQARPLSSSGSVDLTEKLRNKVYSFCKNDSIVDMKRSQESE